MTAGWYRDPRDPNRLRFHDGVGWRPEMVPTDGAPSGWYLDPSDQRHERYFNGGWTGFTRLALGDDPGALIGRPRTLPATPRPLSRHQSRSSALLVAAGVLLAGYASWTLWGTGVYTDWQQARLFDDFTAGQVLTYDVVAAGLDSAPVGRTGVFPRDDDPTLGGAVPPTPDSGRPVALLTIPSIGVETVVVSGTSVDALRSGPGWARETAFPTFPGNTVIAGHRSTYGAPFARLDEVRPGNQILLQLPGEPVSVYEVRDVFVVEPDEVGVAEPTGGVRLTLSTCHPPGSDAQRLIVQAELVAGANAADALPDRDWRPYDGARVPL